MGLKQLGLGFESGSSLVERALAAIESGPRSTPSLARDVLGLRSAPPGLAARLVYDLLGSDGRVSVDGAGVWRLAVVSPADDSLSAAALSSLEFAVVDVETTGGTPWRGDRVVEFAAIQVRGGRVVGEFSSLVNPGRVISPFVSRLTGITADMLATAPTFSEIAGRVRKCLEGKVFVAHNAGFDWRFVAEEMRRASTLLPVGPRLCTVRLTRRAVPGLRRRGLESVADYFGVPVRGRHRAGGDALATARVLIRLLEEASRAEVETWEQLQLWLAGRPSGRRQAERTPGK
ncbi:MAG: 3'-5' exonuclease [Gemmatimonadota bacterium]